MPIGLPTDTSYHTPLDGGISVNGLRWRARIENAQAERYAAVMVQQHGLPDLLARILCGRGVTPESVEHFLQPSLKYLLPDPAHLLDMDAAIARIAQAIAARERIAIFGDYDVDGATSTALLIRYFRALSHDAMIYIPDRMKEGYGPTLAAFEHLAAQGITLIITVDCGIVSFEPIAAMKAAGVDVVVIDHHQAQPQLPEACAIVNPNRVDQDSECGHLAAVGVVFLLLVALNRHLRETGYHDAKNEPNLLQWLDLVALGTICDVVSLTGVNRALVTQGLKVMAQRRNKGIAALCDVAALDEMPGTYHVGFLIGPRINAGGRVGASDLGSRILSSEDDLECREIADMLNRYNVERQAIEASVLEQAMAQAESQANQPCILVADDGWHEGVIGIVAGRLKEQFSRPAFVMSIQHGKAKGSARSVPGADIGAAVTSARLEGLLLAGGGHAMAAGFSLDVAQLDAFRDYINTRLERAVSDYHLGRHLRYDGMASVGALGLAMVDALDQAGPYGMGNPSPRIVIPDVRLLQCERMKSAHLRLLLADAAGGKARLKAVCFNVVDTPLGLALESWAARMPEKAIYLAGQLKRNRWNGYESPQFLIDDAMLI